MISASSASTAAADVIKSALKQSSSSPLHAFVARVPSQAWNALSEEQQIKLVRETANHQNLKWVKASPASTNEWLILQTSPTSLHETGYALISRHIDLALDEAVGREIESCRSTDVWVSRRQKRNPDDSWAPLERIRSSSQAPPTFVLEFGMSEGQASLDAVADEYLTGDLAEKIHAALIISIDGLPLDRMNEQPRITFVPHTNSFQDERYQRRSQHLLTFQYGDPQANALNIPAHLFVAKGATLLPPNFQTLANLQILTDPAMVLSICQDLCELWRTHRERQ